MKFKLDENLPELVRVALNELGHDAHFDEKRVESDHPKYGS